MVLLFEGATRNWKSVLGFCAFSLVFLAAQFGYQILFSSNITYQIALVRSFAYAGTTFFAAALLLSVIFKFKPALLKHWPLRRNLGVIGTFFIFLHISLAMNFYFGFDLSKAFFSLNPFENPIVFGGLAIPIFVLLALISTDWVMQKLGANWKKIQRLVYIGFMLSIFHFMKINPAALEGVPWMMLASLTVLAMAGELYWFVRTSIEKKRITFGTLAGVAIILIYLVLGYLSFFAK